LSTSELLYVAKKLGNQNIPLAAQKSRLSALAASENAALYDSYFNIIATNSNRELLRPAVRGIERLIENATIDASGKILESK
jgi:hypothetical protein